MADLPAGYPKDCAARFRPERKLAEGGFGAVWLATQVALDRPAAVKLLRGDLPPGSDALARFTHEGRITAALEHPNIVRVLDHDVENGTPWIAFEYLPGPTPFLTAKCLESRTHFSRDFHHRKLYEQLRGVLPGWKAALDALGGEEALMKRPAGPELVLVYHILRRESYGETTHGDKAGVQAESTARIDAAIARLREAPSPNPYVADHLINWSRKSVKFTTRPGAPR